MGEDRTAETEDDDDEADGTPTPGCCCDAFDGVSVAMVGINVPAFDLRNVIARARLFCCAAKISRRNSNSISGNIRARADKLSSSDSLVDDANGELGTWLFMFDDASVPFIFASAILPQHFLHTATGSVCNGGSGMRVCVQASQHRCPAIRQCRFVARKPNGVEHE